MEAVALAEIQPFEALRFSDKAGSPVDLCCPPYDVISPAVQAALYERSPYNVIRLELSTGDNPYESAASTLERWLDDGILRHDCLPVLYLYQISFRTKDGELRSIDGLMARVKLTPFSEGIVLPHEETLSGPKEDRFKLMCATGCNFSPVYSLYRDADNVTGARLAPIYDTKPLLSFDLPPAEGHLGVVTHSFWQIRDEALIEALRQDFQPRKLYIADGHHRYETALRYRDHHRCGTSDHCMMLLTNMAHPGLTVYPTHRLISNIKNFEPGMPLSALSEVFDIVRHTGADTLETTLAAMQDSVAYYVGGDEYWTLTLRDSKAVCLSGHGDAYCSLDVTRLHTLILEPLFGIDAANMANQKNLTYTRDSAEALDSVRRGDSQCAFFLNPTKVSEILDVSLAGEKMPQKSTYFYPKPVTGPIMNDLRVDR